MKMPLAWRNVMHSKARTALALSSITFAIALMFMQLALHETCQLSASLVLDMMDFDVLITSSQYYCMQQPGSLPRERLATCCEVPGVTSALPIYFSSRLWRNPKTGSRYPLMIMGVSPEEPIFVSPEIRKNLPLLHRTNTALMDRTTMPMYGSIHTGLVTEVGTENVEIVGLFTNGGGFDAPGILVVGDQTLIALGSPLDRATFGLVKLEPGADRAAAVSALREKLPPDVRPITRDDLLEWETHYWLDVKPIGIMFSSGVYVGLAVGAVILYQVLAGDIASRLKEYATMKALGFSARQINRTVMQQGLIFAVTSYLAGLAIGFVVYWLINKGAGIPLVMTWTRASSVFALTMLMCAGSGILALRKLNAADPADLF